MKEIIENFCVEYEQYSVVEELVASIKGRGHIYGKFIKLEI